jgi:hypothetical protein
MIPGHNLLKPSTCTAPFLAEGGLARKNRKEKEERKKKKRL